MAVDAGGEDSLCVGLTGMTGSAVLGFEDCSSKTENVSAAELSLTKPYVREHEELTPKAWSFYGFDITPDDYQVVVNVATEAGGEDDACA